MPHAEYTRYSYYKSIADRITKLKTFSKHNIKTRRTCLKISQAAARENRKLLTTKIIMWLQNLTLDSALSNLESL